MISAGIRELKNNLSRYIGQLSTEKRILVTDRGRTVAELRLPDEKGSDNPQWHRYTELVTSGVIRPAVEKGDPLADWPTPEDLKVPAGTVAALIDEDRDGR